MNYFVFEAGSRAGFSMEIFFLYNRRKGCFQNDTLYMVDDDSSFHSIESEDRIKRIGRKDALELLKGRAIILPCDELYRQSVEEIQACAANDKYASVQPQYYDKAFMNDFLSDLLNASGIETSIRIPLTFETETAFIRPNKKSAGSKGVMSLEGYCVTEKIDIKSEYVVDVINNHGFHLYGREVKLKNGYDKYIRILPKEDILIREVAKFVELLNNFEPLLVNGIYHLQLCEDTKGRYYYIESSKRISGTSIVNLFFGYNPLVLYGGVEAKEIAIFDRDKWYRYEDFILGLPKLMK